MSAASAGSISLAPKPKSPPPRPTASSSISDRVILVNAIAVLAGAAATGSNLPEQAEIPKPPSIPVSVPSELLRQRPDIRAAERNVAAANADIGVATAAFYPSISIGASSGFDATSVGDLFQASSLVWSIGSSALTPVTSQKYLQGAACRRRRRA